MAKSLKERFAEAKIQDLHLRQLVSKFGDTLPPRIRTVVAHEIQRLANMPSNGHEYGPTVDYVETLLTLPWKRMPHGIVDLEAATSSLNKTHFGMSKVKSKVLELIATMNNRGQQGGVIALIGPPGVGKTSIANSIAKAMGRKAVTVFMGGVDDAAEIKGHRRTYVGAMPGKIIQALIKAKVPNPVMILDEGDKTGETRAGNPNFALLEPLDPTQNKKFKDAYVGLECDLSDVLFIINANDIDSLPPALIDRMEKIELRAYIDEEKMEIARKYIIPAELHKTGLKSSQLRITDAALHELINDYTNEAGVRKLTERIKDLCRKCNLIFQTGSSAAIVVDPTKLRELLGPSQKHKKSIPAEDKVGQTTGLLYWDEVGGDIMPIQVSLRPADKFKITVTGHSGRMIDEFALYGTEMIQMHAQRYGIEPKKLNRTHIHVHLSDSGTPKDGPSAGLAITAAIISALTGIKTKRNVAMTGEIDLHGNALPIGGLTGKLIGARRAGIDTVLIPWDNQRSLHEVPEILQRQIKIIPVKTIDEVLQHTLTGTLPQATSDFALAAQPEPDDPTPDELRRVFAFIMRGAGDSAPVRAVERLVAASAGKHAGGADTPGTKPG